MNEELNYILPKNDNTSIEEILEINNLSHWVCVSKNSFERIDGVYFNLDFSIKYLNSKGNNYIVLLKEYDRLYPIKQEPEEAFA